MFYDQKETNSIFVLFLHVHVHLDDAGFCDPHTNYPGFGPHVKI